MNFLAHLYLAEPTPESIAGNLAADFLSPLEEKTLSQGVREGIHLHRRIDYFTDRHPVFLRSRRRIHDRFRHLKGILIDLFFDHFLAVHWHYFHEDSLEAFASFVYETLEGNQDILSRRLRHVLPYMVEENWLVSYREINGIDLILQRMSQRLSRRTVLGEGTLELRNHYRFLEADFLTFFPLLIEFVKKEKRSYN